MLIDQLLFELEYLLEGFKTYSDKKLASVYDDLVQRLKGADIEGTPTLSWLTSNLARNGKIVGKLVDDVERMKDSDNHEERNLYKLYNALLDAGLVKRYDGTKMDRHGMSVQETRNNLFPSMKKFAFTKLHDHFNKPIESLPRSKLKSLMGDIAAEETGDWESDLGSFERAVIQKIKILSPEDLANLRGIIKARDHKRAFSERLSVIADERPVISDMLTSLGILDGKTGTIRSEAMERFRAFMKGLSPSRLRDVFSPSVVTNTKQHAHDESRNRSSVLRDIESDGYYRNVINLYNNIAQTVNSPSGFRSRLSRLKNPRTGKPVSSKVVRDVMILAKVAGGSQLDPKRALDSLKQSRIDDDNLRQTQKVDHRNDKLSDVIR